MVEDIKNVIREAVKLENIEEYLIDDNIKIEIASTMPSYNSSNNIFSDINQYKKTIIAVAHRLSTTKNANRIIFIKNSTINNIRNFKELLEHNIFFQKLIQLNNTNLIH